MLDYFLTYYIGLQYGPAYIATNLFFVLAAVALLNDWKRDLRGVLRYLVETAVCWLGTILYCSVYYFLLGDAWMDRTMMAVFLIVYALTRSKYRRHTRLVRSAVFYTCTILALPISEPIGDWIKDNINEAYTWAEHLTSVVMVGLLLLAVWFLRRFSTEQMAFVPAAPAAVIVAISALGVALQLTALDFDVPRGYALLEAIAFWIMETLAYYMFYMVSREYEQNLDLLAMQHREELDEELLQFSRDNYEEMHQIRHEVKNHLAYIRTLSSAGEYDKLQEYLEEVAGETEELFQFVECGNEVINAVMNHAIRVAKARGVEMEHQLVVPPELPYQETDLCSLLSNLTDNAIEAAAASGKERPVVSVSIRPQQDYLFLRVTNPVDESVPEERRLSLHTTKADQRSHGYGTKVIRKIAGTYQGSVRFTMQNGLFVADVMLFLEEKQNEEDASGNL